MGDFLPSLVFALHACWWETVIVYYVVAQLRWKQNIVGKRQILQIILWNHLRKYDYLLVVAIPQKKHYEIRKWEIFNENCVHRKLYCTHTVKLNLKHNRPCSSFSLHAGNKVVVVIFAFSMLFEVFYIFRCCCSKENDTVGFRTLWTPCINVSIEILSICIVENVYSLQTILYIK